MHVRILYYHSQFCSTYYHNKINKKEKIIQLPVVIVTCIKYFNWFISYAFLIYLTKKKSIAVQSIWRYSQLISKELKKSSKQKQKLYIKFLKNKSIQNEEIYKNYKHLFEKLRRKAKQTYYQFILKDCQNDMTRTW